MDDLDSLLEEAKTTKCSLGRWMAKMEEENPSNHAKLLSALKSEEYGHTALVRTLFRLGLTISARQVKRHRDRLRNVEGDACGCKL